MNPIMLRELSIKNFAIIDDLSISFEKGLTVLTGETGAGKSIIINAVNLILGSRASPELIRTSEETAELEALFEMPPESPAGKVAERQGVDLSEGLLVRRIIQRNGRHRIYINGRLATVQMLSQINEHLASISGQHAHQSLLKPEQHLLVLDQFGDSCELRGRVSECHEQMILLVREWAGLKRQHVEQTEKMELLEFQCREIEQASIAHDEDKELEQERQRLKHAQRLYETVGRCVNRLYGAEGAVVEHVTGVARELQTLSNIDSSLTPMAERVQEASFKLEDIANDLRGYLPHVVFDSNRLEDVELRLDLLQRLKRKYGGSLESVVEHARKAEEELKRISLLPERIAEVEERLDELHKKLCKLCRELSEKRRKASERLSAKVQHELASLGMSGTRFQVRFKPSPVDESTDPHLVLDNMGIEATGIDRVDFLIAPNVGEDLRPLVEIASGGELSRIVLALKAILATKESVETVIFDEVDAGIGGGVAEVVGQKLQTLAHFHQVICITHLPQIAQSGKHHFRIAKKIHRGRTSTTITALHGEARVKEMARMLGGVKITRKTLDHAREMMMGRGIEN
ncbi:MAG: DNA repair protein RecN [Deltaproteobacteria bacterium]|nr:DNA repair protein RecN [Deltaproteobacteria bacterium]